jgi:hypothetical protein
VTTDVRTVSDEPGKNNPEPVPAATQLAALPFLAAIDGYLRGASPSVNVRLTLHRAMTREGNGYLQQICDYLGTDNLVERTGGGRLFPVDVGIVGAACRNAAVMRTKELDSPETLASALEKENPSDPYASWLAVPFLNAKGSPVLVLFASTHRFNYFAEEDRTETIVRMCWGFCRVIEQLSDRPLPSLRNFAFASADPVTGGQGVYGLQEIVKGAIPPRFERVQSFNFEASAG